jgi:hypothetical protein
MEILVMQCSRTFSNNFSPKSKLFPQLHVFKYSQCAIYLYVED